ncbi:MAG: alpha/beta hydrolase [Alphaproteobacteria bacterium]
MPTVVMVHGAFCGGWAFEHFRGFYEAAGWTVLTPDLPGRGFGQSAAGLSVSDYATSVVKVCESLSEAPVLLGHSMGGLICQLAARRVQARALVLLAPSAPWGIHGSTMEEAATAFGVQLADPFWIGSVAPDRSLMRSHGLDRVPRAQQAAILDRLCPESGRAIREVLNWWLDPFMSTSVGVGALPMPSLVVAGERDAVHPVYTVRQTADRIGATYAVMPGMSHWLIGEDGWATVAGATLDWLAKQPLPVSA